MFSDLNKNQKEAVFSGQGPLLIVAGAGSGKTKTLTSRLAYLISQKNIKPERILSITFTNKAAQEMKERVGKMMRENNFSFEKEPYVGTFHSFGAKILRNEGKYFERTADFSIFDSDDSLRLLKKIMKGFNFSEKLPSPPFFLKEFSRAKSELIDLDMMGGDEKRETIKLLFENYEEALKKNNAFDFDDLIEKIVRLFQINKEILDKYQKKYDYILVDEYQDINTSQYRMLKMLSGSHNNVNVVGDDSQSIYAFRFSDFRNFLNFERDWPNAKTVLLEQNYRSTKNIIESSSALILKNSVGKPKTLWTQNEQGAPVRVMEHDDEFSQADFVVQKANLYLKNNQTVGILFRTNAQSRALEQIFLEYGIDYNIFGAVSFYERKEVKDIVSALRFASNPSDQISFERLSKNFYKKTAEMLREELPKRAGELLPSDLIGFFLKSTDYFESLKKEYPNYLERYENINELIYFASQFKTLTEFLEKISLASPLDAQTRKKRDKKNISGANLMTIHLAKGLEFDVVFVAGVNEGILPHQRSLFSNDDLEEERRLMYVAMTRARKELFLNFYDVPSRFLYELPSEMVEFSGEKKLDDEERYIEYD